MFSRLWFYNYYLKPWYLTNFMKHISVFFEKILSKIYPKSLVLTIPIILCFISNILIFLKAIFWDKCSVKVLFCSFEEQPPFLSNYYATFDQRIRSFELFSQDVNISILSSQFLIFRTVPASFRCFELF